MFMSAGFDASAKFFFVIKKDVAKARHFPRQVHIGNLRMFN